MPQALHSRVVWDSFSLTLAIFAEKAFFSSLCVELLFLISMSLTVLQILCVFYLIFIATPWGKLYFQILHGGWRDHTNGLFEITQAFEYAHSCSLVCPHSRSHPLALACSPPLPPSFLPSLFPLPYFLLSLLSSSLTLPSTPFTHTYILSIWPYEILIIFHWNTLKIPFYFNIENSVPLPGVT